MRLRLCTVIDKMSDSKVSDLLRPLEIIIIKNNETFASYINNITKQLEEIEKAFEEELK